MQKIEAKLRAVSELEKVQSVLICGSVVLSIVSIDVGSVPCPRLSDVEHTPLPHLKPF